MGNTKERPGFFDGLQRAEPDEPVFPLRAHDKIAPATVHHWVKLRREEINRAFHADEMTADKRRLELAQCREAEEIAWQMVAWQARERDEAVEIEAEAQKPTYSGNVKTAEELAAKAQYDAIRSACEKINDAIGEVMDAARETLSPYGLEAERLVLLTMASRLTLVSDHLAPKRASYAVGVPLPPPFDLKAALVCMGDIQAQQVNLVLQRYTTDPAPSFDPAISGLDPVAGHAEGCGVHDGYECDCHE